MARKDVGEMNRAAGFQVDFWTEFVAEVVRLGGTSDQLYGSDQARLHGAARAAAQSIIGQSIPPHGGRVIGRLTLKRVDHGRTIELGVEAGRYNGHVNPNITSANFPHKCMGVEENVEFDLIQFTRDMTTVELDLVLPTFGDLPDMDDMLTTGVEAPDEQRKNPLVFWGALWVSPDGGREVGYLSGSAEFRVCRLVFADPQDQWYPSCVFPVRARK